MDINNHPLKKPLHVLKIYLARQFSKLFSPDKFVAISGSVGKTTCVSAAVVVLSQKFKTISTQLNLDPVLNVPSTILKLNPSYKKVVLEMGVEYRGEMDFYLSLVRPKTAIITKISYASDEIIEEKVKLIESLPEDGVAILNWDDPLSKKLAAKCRANLIYFGTDAKNCTVWAGNVKIENFKTTFELNLGVERVKVNLQLLGLQQIYPVLAAAALGVTLDIPLTKIKLALESIQPQEHRMQPILGPNGSIILDDTYNASPAAMDDAIDALLQIPSRRRILVLGEMKELGNNSESLHRKIGERIYKEKLDLVLLGSGGANFIAEELRDLGFLEDRFAVNLQTGQIVSRLLRTLGKGDVCLIKGSRATRLDEVVKRIAKKT